MHQIRPFLRQLRQGPKFKRYDDDARRIPYIQGCLRDLTGDENVMIALVMEYLKRCNLPATRETIHQYIGRLSVEQRIDSSIDQLNRKGILTENATTKILKLTI